MSGDSQALAAEFVNEFCGTTETLPKDADILEHLRITGDDVSDFMEGFAARFDVDMRGYLWYFHHEEEFSPNFGALVFKPPSERVKRIPITTAVLSEAIDTKRWPIVYPEHHLPKVRWDIVFNIPIGLLLVLLLGLIAAAVNYVLDRAFS